MDEAARHNYILDTSALRAIGRSELEAVARVHTLLLSPVSFWEVLCHLDETNTRRPREQQAFEYGRSLLLKCRIPTLLEDPFAAIASRSGVPTLVNPTRFEDRQGIPLILEQLHRATSLSDFAQRQVVLPGTSQRPIGDIVQLTRECLAEIERAYQRDIERTATRIIEGFGADRAADLQGTQFYHLALRACALSLYQEAVGAGEPDRDLFHRLSVASYVCGGYLVARTLLGLQHNGFRARQISVDGNDAEDFMITMHVSWNERSTFVTNDRGTLDAVGRVLRELGRHMTSLNITPDISATVIDVEGFRREVSTSI